MGLFNKLAGWSKPVAVKLTKAQAAKAAKEEVKGDKKRQAEIRKKANEIKANLFTRA
jgi:hypothetical protein